jgi:hypothetical protein
MLGSEINDYFHAHPVLCRHYLGVFASNEVRKIRWRTRDEKESRVKKFAIVNTDTLSGDGLHWYCLSKLECRTELFDPLGCSLEVVEKRLGRKVRLGYFNSRAVQGDSDSCGSFCCYWAYARFFNADKKFAEVLNSYFTDDVLKNEAIIEEFIDTGNLLEQD